jgi:hypothetical protein
MAVTRRTLRLQEELRAQLQQVTDEQTRALTSAWADAWDEVATDLRDTLVTMLADGARLTPALVLRSRRLQIVLLGIAGRLDVLAQAARITITADLPGIVRTAAHAQAQIVDSQLPELTGLVDFEARVPDRALDAIVRRSTQQITALTRPLSAEAASAVRRELIRGVASGTGARDTAARMVRRSEQRFNGGLTRAMTISRTETLDAHRTAAQEGQALHADVLAGWTWLAKLDEKTCRSCWSKAGTVYPVTEAGPLDHQSGRCARMPKTQSWADLGFDLEEPADLTPDPTAQFAALAPEQQARILGRAGYAAWLRGEFPIEAWSRKRTSTGWRDSFGVAPAPQSGGRLGSVA